MPPTETSSARPAFTVVAVETTGLSPQFDRIIELAFVQLDAECRSLDSWQTLVNPGMRIGTTGANGITDEMLAAAPSFSDLAPQLAQKLGGTVLVGHNIAFDLRFLHGEMDLAVQTLKSLPTICTLALARSHIDGPGKFSLEGCCTLLGLDTPPLKTTLALAQSTAALLRHFQGHPFETLSWWQAKLAAADSTRPAADVERAWPTKAEPRPAGLAARQIDQSTPPITEIPAPTAFSPPRPEPAANLALSDDWAFAADFPQAEPLDPLEPAPNTAAAQSTFAPQPQDADFQPATPTVEQQKPFLERIIATAPDSTLDAEESETLYGNTLQRFLADRRLAITESAELRDLAHTLGLKPARITDIHTHYLQGLITTAWAEGEPAAVERQELSNIGQLLGVPREVLHSLLEHIADTAPSPVPGLEDEPLYHGQSIHISGMQLRENPALGEHCQELGLTVTGQWSRQLDVVVLPEEKLSSHTARESRRLGMRVLTERDLRKLLDDIRPAAGNAIRTPPPRLRPTRAKASLSAPIQELSVQPVATLALSLPTQSGSSEAARTAVAEPQPHPGTATQPSTEQQDTPAGWYHDPWAAAEYRWWDGERWTASLYPSPPSPEL